MRGFVHERRKPQTCEWYTPPELFSWLGMVFDLDPASPGAAKVPWVPAVRHLTKAEDGLRAPWHGQVWLNPPYGSDTPWWMSRFVDHGAGVALVFARTDTQWWQSLVRKVGAVLFLCPRVHFVREDGAPAGSPGCGSALWACGEFAVRTLAERQAREPRGWLVNTFA